MFMNGFLKNNRTAVLGVSAAVGSVFLYYFMMNNRKIEEPIKKKEIYERKYYEKYDLLEMKELDEEYVKGLTNSVVYESTPKGRVIMYYDADKESFIYYCDTKDISYLYLEAVARKYALTYDCKKLVVDIKKELKDATDIKNGVVIVPKKVVDDKAKIFASFKNYNKKSGEINNGNKKYVLRQNANRYSYKGKVCEYNFIKPADYKSENTNDKMDYETFKRLMDKKN